MKRLLLAGSLALALSGVSTAVAQVKDCEELKSEIAAKLDAKGVKNYTLEIVGSEDVGNLTVVGSCGGGSKRIIYKRT